LVCLAQVADAQQQPELGVQLLGKADAFVAPMELQLLPFDREQHQVISARLRSRVDVMAWDEAWEVGRRLSLEEAIQAAQALSAESRATGGGSPSPELTDRQLEILRLVAAGLGNKEIAARLFIAPGTVKRHLENVFAKIGVRTRAAVAVWAIENDLL
jgi:DNA-binding NarL/FixJ family response regulator